MFFLSGGPALPEGSNGDRHTGRHLEGDAEVVLHHHLQAGGQHKWRRLDDVSPRQEPQGKQSKEPFYLCSRVRAGGTAHNYYENGTARKSKVWTLYC